MSDLPQDVLIAIFAFIHPLKVEKYRLLSRSFNSFLTSKHFALLNLSKWFLATSRNYSKGIKPSRHTSVTEEVRILFHGRVQQQEAITTLLSNRLKTSLLVLGACGPRVLVPIPSSIGRLILLESLSLSLSGLNGCIPREIGSLKSLKHLDLKQNSLEGQIPDEIGNLTHLKYLGLQYNKLSGRIPASLSRLKNLDRLQVNGNRLDGCIPPELGLLSSVKYMKLEENRLEGSIPPELGELSNLIILSISKNRFEGSIPSSFCHLNKLRVMSVDNNNLSPPDGVVATWLKEQRVIFEQ
ncbi:hypothetical protein BDR26DRAFT_991508 [Obelidium mucronatum]|nr:hypothetical protein BDR26DRAFT_991508 [Obelidium mucronatum]